MTFYEIIGNGNSAIKGLVYGHFTTKELAEAGRKMLSEEVQNVTEVSASSLAVNTLEPPNGVIDLTATKSAEEIIASRDEDNYVEGYVCIHISDIIDNDYEGFLDLISEALVGSNLLMDINYDVVSLGDVNELILRVRGDVSGIIEMDEDTF